MGDRETGRPFLAVDRACEPCVVRPDHADICVGCAIRHRNLRRHRGLGAAHISTRQYARLVDEWVTGIGLPGEDYGTHSLRRTKASIIYKATGNLRAVQILLGHTKIESTVRYLGVDVEDALTLAEGTEI